MTRKESVGVVETRTVRLFDEASPLHLVRGGTLSQVDVAYETPMAIVNRNLAGVETVFLLPDPAHAHVSSSLVRQVAALGGDVSPYVPPAVAEYLQTP